MNYISSSLSEAENSDGVEILSQSSQKLKAEELFVVDWLDDSEKYKKIINGPLDTSFEVTVKTTKSNFIPVKFKLINA